MHRYFIINKPFGMLSQFSREGDHDTLADLKFDFEKDVYPVGRLDSDSEGLLLLTNDKQVNHRLLDPKFKHERTYLAQVEGAFTGKAKTELEQGVSITINGTQHQTLPCKVNILDHTPELPERNPPVRFRKNIPTSFIELTLTEGKNRQVRKMTAAAGFPTLRLIRVAIEALKLDGMNPGEVREISYSELKKACKL